MPETRQAVRIMATSSCTRASPSPPAAGPWIMHIEQTYPFEMAKRAIITMNSESWGKATGHVRSRGITLQNRKAGMKANRTRASTSTVSLPARDWPGSFIMPAKVRPHRSPEKRCRVFFLNAGEAQQIFLSFK